MACISYFTACSAVGASIGCRKITWLAAVRLVPEAESSNERSNTKLLDVVFSFRAKEKTLKKI